MERGSARPFTILSIDGGGSKGVYSLGVLTEVEQQLGQPLWSYFDLMFGTSTGAIIVALLSLGHSVSEVEKMYFDIIPDVMRHKRRRKRSEALVRHAHRVFGEKTFSDFKTDVGIVACNYDAERPMIFKTSRAQAFGRAASFRSGFGVRISEAVLASAAAFPFFDKVQIKTDGQGDPQMIDGGFAANNPTLLAIADGHNALKVPRERIRVLSVGVGHYNEPKRSTFHRFLFSVWPFQIIQKLFATSTNTLERLRQALFPDVVCVRVDETYADPRYATDLLESDPAKLRKLFVLGRESYGKHEAAIREALPTIGV